MSCTRCQTVTTFPSEGICLIYPTSDMIYRVYARMTVNVEEESGHLKVEYKEGDLLKLTNLLTEHLEERALKASRMGCFMNETDLNGFEIITAY